MCHMSILSILTKLEQTEFAAKIINDTRKSTKIGREKRNSVGVL